MAVLALAVIKRMDISVTDRDKLRASLAISLVGPTLIDSKGENVFYLVVSDLDASVSRATRDTAIADAIKTELTNRGITVGLTDTVAVQ